MLQGALRHADSIHLGDRVQDKATTFCPSNSAESQQTFDSPRMGAVEQRSYAPIIGGFGPTIQCQPPHQFDPVHGPCSWGPHLQQQLLLQRQHLLAAPPATPTAAAGFLQATAGCHLNNCHAGTGDQGSQFKQAVMQGLAHMKASELAELQQLLKQQRLERQQQELPPLTPAVAAAAAAAAAKHAHLPGPLTGLGGSNTSVLDNAANLIRQLAAAVNASAEVPPLPVSGTAAKHLAAPAAAAPAAAAPQHSGAPAVLASPTAAATHVAHIAQQQQHPGVSRHRSARNTPRRRAASWAGAQQALGLGPQPPAPQASATLDMAAAGDAAAAAAGQGLHARFGRLPAEIQAQLLLQLQQLEEAEQQWRPQPAARRAGREATTSRRSTRTRKTKRWDGEADSSSNRDASPDPAAAAAESAERAGSAEANNTNHGGGVVAAGSCGHEEEQQQQPQPVVKRVRFDLANEHDIGEQRQQRRDGSTSSTSPDGMDEDGDADADGEEAQRQVIVRRVGPRAQARKRMHKRTARRRRPQRAPLS